MFAFAACYRGTSSLAPCTVRCTEGCPSGTTCMDGFCASPGGGCPLDAPACGQIGTACCETAPACGHNGYCDSTKTCQAGCVTDVSLGRHHMCVVEYDHTVRCAGADDTGQLGNGSAGSASTAFTQALDATGPISDATAVTAGRGFSCAIRAGGTVWCWGYGGDGELGNGMYADSRVAVQVLTTAPAPLTGMEQVVMGRYHACARGSDGSVWCWGYNNDGELGDGTNSGRANAAQITTLTNVKAIASGEYHACALDGDGHVLCWGYNSAGEIGDGTQNNALAPVHILDATAVATGFEHTCALLSDTTIKCWGLNRRRWIGTGVPRDTNTLTPTPVLAPDGTSPYTGAKAIALGAVTCALREDGHVDCVGDDIHGQVGHGGTDLMAPVIRDGSELSAIDAITAHYAHVCAHRDDGSILCWGRNSEGEFGDGTVVNRSEPEPLGATCAASATN